MIIGILFPAPTGVIINCNYLNIFPVFWNNKMQLKETDSELVGVSSSFQLGSQYTMTDSSVVVTLSSLRSYFFFCGGFLSYGLI